MSAVIQNAIVSFCQKNAVPDGAKIAAAVSGGADSLALAFNLSEYAIRHHWRVYALTVNHGLRAEAKQEADTVHELLTPLGIKHTELVWTGVKPKTHMEEKAREKRYELMSEWCKKHDIKYLFLAHHQGDQAETFWIRLARGSGVDGLSAMAEISQRSGVNLCRPLLDLTKRQLEQDLVRRHVKWVVDSMNNDEIYERVYWRHHQDDLSQMNLTPAVVGRSAARLNRAKQALDFYANRFYDSLVEIVPQGYATIPLKALSSVPAEIQIRVLMATIRVISQSKSPLSLSGIEDYITLQPTTATLGGCILIRRNGLLYIAREYRHIPKPKSIPAHIKTKWERFTILSTVPLTVSVGKRHGKDLPAAVECAIPFIENGGKTVSFITGDEKGLEKKYNLDYKERKITLILFNRGEK